MARSVWRLATGCTTDGRQFESRRLSQSQSQSYFATDSQSVRLGVEPDLGLLTRDNFFF
jgi:hypothetical protein